MTLIIENADKRLLNVIKALNIDNDSPYKVSKNETFNKKNKGMKEAIRQLKNGEVTTWDSLEDFKKAMENVSAKNDKKI